MLSDDQEVDELDGDNLHHLTKSTELALTDGSEPRKPLKRRKSLLVKRRREINEYQHLIKSFRINAELDLTPNLIQELIKPPKSDQDRSRTRKRQKGNWPLPLAEVPVAKYLFSDEVHRIASRVTPPNKDISSSSSTLPDSLVNALAIRERSLLEHALHLLYIHRPHSRTKASVRKAQPVNWETLLAAMAASNAVDRSVLESTHKRMDALFGGQLPPPTYRKDVVDWPFSSVPIVARGARPPENDSAGDDEPLPDYLDQLDSEIAFLEVAKAGGSRARMQSNVLKRERERSASRSKGFKVEDDAMQTDEEEGETKEVIDLDGLDDGDEDDWVSDEDEAEPHGVMGSESDGTVSDDDDHEVNSPRAADDDTRMGGSDSD